MDIYIFIKKAEIVHKGKYDYSKSVYNGYKKKLIIICPIHGGFSQTPDNHLHGHGCPKCGNVYHPSIDEFIEKAKKIHGDKYDYSKSIYQSAKKKIIITCPIHGDFTQTPNKHLNGRGCPLCNESHMERDVRNFLELKGIEFTVQYKIYKEKKLSYDFYLPKYNAIIECQGEQHFSPISFYGNKIRNDKHKYLRQLSHDEEKYKDANDKGIEIFYLINKKYFMNKNIDIFKNKFYEDKLCYDGIEKIIDYLKL